jgi:ABC-type protease/lipase transport system fused ATPase/permease subunit
VLNCMDKLLVLRSGRVEACGPPSEVLLRLVRPQGSATASASPNQEDAKPAQLSSPKTDRKAKKVAQ